MGAEHPERRKLTARETAERLGIAPRTVRKIMAEPRADFLARAAARRVRVVELRQQGWTHARIAEETGFPIGTVGRLLWEAKKLAAEEAQPTAQEVMQERESA